MKKPALLFLLLFVGAGPAFAAGSGDFAVERLLLLAAVNFALGTVLLFCASVFAGALWSRVRRLRRARAIARLRIHRPAHARHPRSASVLARVAARSR